MRKRRGGLARLLNIIARNLAKPSWLKGAIAPSAGRFVGQILQDGFDFELGTDINKGISRVQSCVRLPFGYS